MAVFYTGPHSLTKSAITDTYRTLSEPDPNWAGRDSNGHLHKCKFRPHKTTGKMVRYYTNSRYVITDKGSDEYPSIGHYECSKCGEHFEPGLVYNALHTIILGYEFDLDGYPLTERQFEEALDIFKAKKTITDEDCIALMEKWGYSYNYTILEGRIYSNAA